MDPLLNYARRIEAALSEATQDPHWSPGEAAHYMAKVAKRRHRFEQVACDLCEGVIQPRLICLASYFPNSSVLDCDSDRHRAIRFEYTDRFPASTRVGFAVEHDVDFEQAAICFDVLMRPIFIRLNEHDRMTRPLEELTPERVTSWVETRLMEFLAAYLRIDQGGVGFEEAAATDPVCGMRILPSAAAASGSYCGHPYFFCSPGCLKQFQAEESRYVQIKTT